MKKIPVRQLGTAPEEFPAAERFRIRRVEDITGGKNSVQDLHRHDFFFILALQKGKGIHEIDFTTYQITGHSIFFLRPGQVHQLELKKSCTGYLVEFNSGFYHPKEKSSGQRLRKAGNKNYCILELQRFNRIQAILSSMFHEYNAREEGYRDIIRSSLDIFFIEFVRQSRNTKETKQTTSSYTQERFEELLELLDKHIATRKQVSQYAGLMNLSAYQLNEICRSSIGKTVSQLINEHIVLEAKRYLLATSNQIKDIADQLGYEDVSYFIRFFRKHTGFSPDAFRLHFK